MNNNISPDNRLNELPAREWLRFTKTWFIHNPPPRKGNEVLHPAKYPEDMIEQFICFFTKTGQVVFDPFLGTGSTLVACHNSGRMGIGIELQEKYAEIARQRVRRLEGQLTFAVEKVAAEGVVGGVQQKPKQTVIHGNSAEIDSIWQQHSLPEIDFVITSPPYGPMLNKKGLAAKKREDRDLDTKYSEDEQDLGNAGSYEEFLERLVGIFIKLKPKLKAGGYLVVILQNYMDKGEYKMLAWDFAREMSKHYQLRGERLWLQDNKTLFPYGYKYSFVPNVHHHYCLIFRKTE